MVDGVDYDYITRTSFNQGILKTTGFVNSENLNPSGVWSLGLIGMDFFYRTKQWYAGQFIRKVVPKISIPKESISFFTVVLNTLQSRLKSVLVRDVDTTFENSKIQLPTKNGEVDFEFMGDFVAELEAQRVAELEAQRVAELEAYLTATGLNDYDLTEEEEKAIQDYLTVNWKEYPIGELFERVSTKKLPYKAKDLPKEPCGESILPALTSSFMNQGLNYYVPKDEATVLKNVISIPSNSDVYRAYFQSRDFTVLSDAYAIDWIYEDKELNPEQYLFTVPCINKVTDLPIYSYKNKLGGWNVVKKKKIELPTVDGNIDYDYMQTLTKAIQKLVIKDVVDWTDKKIGVAKQVIKN